MKVLFDLTPIQTSYGGYYNGASEYCYSLFLGLVKSVGLKYISFIVDKGRGLQKEISTIIERNNLKMYSYSNHSELSHIINQHDLFYSAEPYNLYDLKLSEDVIFAYTVHGLRDIEITTDSMMSKYEPGLKSIIKLGLDRVRPNYLNKRAKSRIVQLLNVTSNRRIITDSYHTKYAILSNVNGVNSDEISVCYAPSKSSKKYEGNKNEKKNYILMVSGDRWIKNNLRAAIAIDRLISKKIISNDIIITGVKNKNTYTKMVKNMGHFRLEGYVEEDKLERLFAEAMLFVYPSLNEGFGYPPIEAMKYGTTCVCAADTSIPEICGEAVMYFNPYDIKEMETRILQGLSNECREEYCVKMEKQYSIISERQNKDFNTLISLIMGKAN